MGLLTSFSLYEICFSASVEETKFPNALEFYYGLQLS